jgi:hypothetical protein
VERFATHRFALKRHGFPQKVTWLGAVTFAGGGAVARNFGVPRAGRIQYVSDVESSREPRRTSEVRNRKHRGGLSPAHAGSSRQ